jgi:hypothetical protein
MTAAVGAAAASAFQGHVPPAGPPSNVIKIVDGDTIHQRFGRSCSVPSVK